MLDLSLDSWIRVDIVLGKYLEEVIFFSSRKLGIFLGIYWYES